MDSVLQKKIKTYLESTGSSIAALERKAGLKTNVVRNVLRGQSKKPTAERLQALATVMGCTVQELLGVKNESFSGNVTTRFDESPLIDHPEILNKSLGSILEISQENNYTLTLKQSLLLLEEAYSYSIKKDPPEVDRDFIIWFMKRIMS